ncbi:MAG: S8 family serine peptidase [Caldilineales bacterium]
MKTKCERRTAALWHTAAGWLFVLMISAAGAVSPVLAAPTAPTVPVLAPAGTFASDAAGVTLQHDYGAFALYQVSAAALQQLDATARARVQSGAALHTILFDTHPINTRQPEAVPARLTARPSAAALHLVQFVAPIKQAWLDAVQAAGATPIQYLANNAYLVWADAAARSRLEQLAAQGDQIQYSAPLQPANKLGASIEEAILSGTTPDRIIPVVVQIYNHRGKAASQAIISQLAVSIESDWSPLLAFENRHISLRAADLLTIARLPDVVWLGERFPRSLNDEVQGQILAGALNAAHSGPAAPGYKAWLDELGFSHDPAAYPVVNITDDGVGNGNTANGAGDITLTRNGDGVTSRIVYITNCTATASAQSIGGHGHINTNIVAGYDLRAGFPFNDPDGYQRGQGINPYGRVAQTKLFNDFGSYNAINCGGSDTGVIKSEQDHGAQISSNSWSCAGCAATYDASSQAYDAGVRDADSTEAGNQPMIYLFSAGNNGPAMGVIGSPSNGKNMITVGAAENYRPSDEDGSWTDGCGIGWSGADNAMDVSSFSSRGPAPGGRIKPEVIAPGAHVQGTASPSPAYTGSSVCDPYRPGGQTVYAASSGTSHSTPAVAGVASLIYHWLQTHHGITPSPALMKAYLIAHPTYLTGVAANDTLPSNSQGYGMPNMQTAFDDSARLLVNESTVFDNPGETWTWSGAVADPNRPVRIVLAYSDAPGAIGVSPQVNNLDLAAVMAGEVYLGNRFSGQWSITGGAADAVNNYEAIFLPAGSSGPLAITISAANIAGDGVPNSGDNTDQDFALVCYNCTTEADFTLQVTPAAQTVCAAATTTYSVAVDSINGFSGTATLSAANLPSGVTAVFTPNPVAAPDSSTLVISSSADALPGSYTIQVSGEASGSLHTVPVELEILAAAPVAPELLSPANGASNVVSPPVLSWNGVPWAAFYGIQLATDPAFNHIVDHATTLTLNSWSPTVALTSNTVYYWRTWASNSCGSGSYSAVWSFTTALGPADCSIGTTTHVLFSDGFETGLGNWSSSGTGNTWVLTGNPAYVYSGAQAMHATDPTTVSDQRLVSPPIVLPSGENPVVLKFWNAQSFEDFTGGCFDGGLVELSNDGGATWTPVPAADLLNDPYNGPIHSAYGNPLGGLAAWCGDPQPYLNSVIDISAYAGQTVQLRFRLGSDDSTGRTDGWNIDDVLVQSCTVPTAVVLNEVTGEAQSHSTASSVIAALLALGLALLAACALWPLRPASSR